MNERYLYQIHMTNELSSGSIFTLVFDLEDIQMMTYYVYLIDPVQAERFYESAISKFLFEIDNDLGYPVSKEEEDFQELSFVEIPLLKDFINQQIIPVLETDVQSGNKTPFISIWGINDSFSFWDMIYAEEGILSKMFQIHCDNLDQTPKVFLDNFKSLSLFYQHVINDNLNYKVYRVK